MALSVTDHQFSSFIEWLMCSEPWPLMRGHQTMNELADEEAKKRGRAHHSPVD
jgi:hypothetical protein